MMLMMVMLIMIISLTQSYYHGEFVLLLLIHSSTILYDIDYMLQHMSKYPYTVASTTKDSTTATTITTTTTTTTLVLDRTHNYTSYHSLLVYLYTVDFWKSIVAIVNNNNNKNRIGNYNILASAMEARTKKKMKNSSNTTSTTIRFSAYNAPHIDSSAKVYMIL